MWGTDSDLRAVVFAKTAGRQRCGGALPNCATSEVIKPCAKP